MPFFLLLIFKHEEEEGTEEEKEEDTYIREESVIPFILNSAQRRSSFGGHGDGETCG